MPAYEYGVAKPVQRAIARYSGMLASCEGPRTLISFVATNQTVAVTTLARHITRAASPEKTLRCDRRLQHQTHGKFVMLSA